MPAQFSHNGPADTPVECITDLLTRALEASEASKKDQYIQKALAISKGLDDYTDAVSTLPSSGCAALIKDSFNHDWKKAHESVSAATLRNCSHIFAYLLGFPKPLCAAVIAGPDAAGQLLTGFCAGRCHI